MLATVRRDGIESGWNLEQEEDEEKFRAPIRAQYDDGRGVPLYATRAHVGRRHRRSRARRAACSACRFPRR